MDEGTIGILILLGISGVVGAVTHWFYRRFISACLFSAFVTTVFFQSVAFFAPRLSRPFLPDRCGCRGWHLICYCAGRWRGSP